jgi:hypothetical protein
VADLKLVGTARFELATPCTPSKCATRLRYVPIECAANKGGAAWGSTSRFYTTQRPANDASPPSPPSR